MLFCWEKFASSQFIRLFKNIIISSHVLDVNFILNTFYVLMPVIRSLCIFNIFMFGFKLNQFY